MSFPINLFLLQKIKINRILFLVSCLKISDPNARFLKLYCIHDSQHKEEEKALNKLIFQNSLFLLVTLNIFLLFSGCSYINGFSKTFYDTWPFIVSLFPSVVNVK